MAPKGLLDRDTSAEAAEEDIDKLGAGRLIPLSEVHDKVFASTSMGSGIAVEPVTGKIIVVPKSGHAYGIKTDDAVEILVHVGIDTVQMKGEGFEPRVARADRVTAGQVIGTADLAAIKKAGFSTTTILVVTNSRKLGNVEPVAGTGEVDGGDTVLTVSHLIHPEETQEAEVKE